MKSCNSFCFYIKPQPEGAKTPGVKVVIHSASTSNHNLTEQLAPYACVVIHSASTSNHNHALSAIDKMRL